MIRRLNYTGRRRIPRENIRIAIYRNGDTEEFDARVSCAGLDLPDNASLLVEAYHKSDWMRFDFGTVGQVVIPRDRRLTAFYRGARVLFRVKAVSTDDESGKILAEADRIVPLSPDSDRDRDPLLPVRVVDGLGSQVWRLTWEGGPVLELNRQEPEVKRLLTSDPRFKWLILPQVLRSILIRILVEGMDEEENEGGGGEGQRWLDFAGSLHPVEPPKPDDRDMELIEIWVDDVVAAFCGRNNVIENWRWSLRPQEDLFSRI
jgi:hypothetical protein